MSLRRAIGRLRGRRRDAWAAFDKALDTHDHVWVTVARRWFGDEAGLPDDAAASFVRTVADSFAGDAASAWTSACAGHLLRGAPVATPLTTRIFRRGPFERWLAASAGVPSSRGPSLLLGVMRTGAFAGELSLGRAAPIWAGFDPARPSSPLVDPLARLLDRLGLEDGRYPRSERYVLVRYPAPSPRVPTAADAGWNNPWWAPPIAGERHGRARDISGLTRADLVNPPRPGYAEVVHDNVKLADVLAAGGSIAERDP